MTKLQLGVSRFEDIDPKVLPIFLNKDWIHLGDPNPETKSLKRNFWSILKNHSPGYIVKRGIEKLTKKTKISGAELEAMYALTNFQDFYFKKGDLLPFEDASMDFIFSEHFFEHLFYDESIALLKECRRILKPNGVIRTVVPDADLRVYEPPEPVGFPDKKLAFTNPHKHKTRWSVYLLNEALIAADFAPVPLHYCDKFGTYVKKDPSQLTKMYKNAPEPNLIFDFSYIIRIDSLIVDGVKGMR